MVAWVALIVATAALLSAPARAWAAVDVSDPRVVADSSMTAGQVATWDCVLLGSYPQSYVDDAATVAALDAAEGWDTDGDLTMEGVTYRRLQKSDATGSSTSSDYWSWGSKASASGWCYFRWEPVKWRVLESDGATALVVSDVALDGRRYHGTLNDVTWETCDLRAWLNGAFWGDCLTAAQQGAVVEQTLANADSISYGTSGGADTTDGVYLLAESDVWNGADAARHGFATASGTSDEARRCRTSDYAHAMGAMHEDSSNYPGNCFWWLRTPGIRACDVACVYYDGGVGHNGLFERNDYIAVRPALTISLNSDQVSWAGTVSSNGDVFGPNDLANAQVSAIADQTFTGSPVEPEVTVTLSGSELTAGTDYTVSYDGNTNVGTATVTVTGCGDYEGTATATFAIVRAPSTISLADQTQTYTGRALAYSGAVARSGSAGDVTFSYYSDAACAKEVGAANVVAAGTYYVRATVAADESHEAATSEAARLTIAKAANTLTVKAKAAKVKLAKVRKKAQTLSVSKVAKVAKAQGTRTYKVAKWTTSKAKKYLKVNAKTGKVTVKKGTPKGTYKFKLQVRAAGNANYKAGAKTVTVKVVVK